MQKNYFKNNKWWILILLFMSTLSFGQAYRSQIISADTGSSTWCPGETRNVTVKIKNIGTMPWKDEGTNDFNIGIKWNANGTSWPDYNVRVDAENLAPGATKTYTFSITASENVGGNYTTPLVTGTNNLTFDVVYELKSWFGNNNPPTGPNNIVFTTPNITIGASIGNNTLTYTNGTSGLLGTTAAENGNAILNSPAGTYFSTVNFASYGTPSGNSPNFAINPTCHSLTSQSVSENYLLGNTNVSIPATNTVFGDPCVRTGKKLAVVASYVQPLCNGSTVTINGSTPTGVPDGVTYRWESSTTNATTGFLPASGTNNLINYTSGQVTQNTWFRRVVLACNTNNTSSVVLVKVNPVFSSGGIATTGQTICFGGDPGIIGSMTSASGGDGTVKYKWQANNVDITGATAATYDPPAGLNATTTFTRYASDNSCNAYKLSTGSLIVTVRSQFITGTISNAGQSLCSGGTPNTIGSTVAASGGDNVITYSWRSSADNYAAAINGATGATYTPPAGIVATTGFRRYAKDGSCNTTPAVSTNTWTVTVNPSNTASAASASPSICIYTSIATVTHTTTGATGIGTAVGLPPGVSATWNADKISITGAPTALGTFNYSIPLTGGCGNANANGTIIVTGPTSTTPNRYISSVTFFTSINPEVLNTSNYSANGYGDYKGLGSQAKQLQGSVINLNVKITNTAGSNNSTIKAWVDWNKDGIYNDDVSEKIYGTDDTGALSGNVLFGYVIPTSTPSGVYTIRIRASTDVFTPCGTTSNGETEDYSFIVVNTCSSKIISVATSQQCGPGSVLLTATATPDTTSYEWYDSEFGTAIAGQTSSTFTTGNLAVGTYIYYVSSKNSTCTSNIRTPIKVIVRPAPVIVLSKSTAEICGTTTTSLIVTSSGDKEEVTVLSDQFENTAANPLQFQNVVAGDLTAGGIWQLRNTPYVPTSPPYNVLKPALSSGFDGGNFASIITDVRQTSNILNNYVTINPVVTTGVTDLKMDFDLYYFSEEDDVTRNYLKVQYTIDGTTWVDLKTYKSDVGGPGKFNSESISLPVACNNSTTLKLRFSVMAFGGAGEWLGDLAAIDNVRIYGIRDLPANFTWSGDPGIIYNSTNCSGPVPAGGSPSVCIKLSDADIKAKSQFTVIATAALANGCSASGNIVINNNTKIWDATTTTDWNTSNWKPADSTVPPVADKCVVIRTPVIIGSGVQALAKEVKVESGGKITINGNNSLTITDNLINNASAQDIIIKSDGNLLQINNVANSGNITAQKLFTFVNGSVPTNDRKQYNYVISPVIGQNLKTIYPGNPTVIYHKEANNFFYASDGAYVPGRGLAIKEPTKAAVGAATATANYVGVPFNGILKYPLAYTNTQTNPANRGFNLVGNPYSSNLNVEDLYEANQTKIQTTFYFWDNRGNTQYSQQGSGYDGDNYAKFNAVSGTGVGTGTQATDAPDPKRIPTQFVKVGTGFMVQTLPDANGKTLDFANTMRTASSGPGFFGKNGASEEKDRYWLNLKTPSNLEFMNAVVYLNQGSKDFGPEDTESFGGSDDIYTIVSEHKLAIQGRDQFDYNDQLDLGLSLFQTGNFAISIFDKEGVFATGQDIYLKDKETGIITNLSQGSYNFTATKGTNSGRFEIIYKSETVLATDSAVKENVIVYREANDFVVKAQSKRITGLEVFDAAGRLMLVLKPNALKTVISQDEMVNGVYILKIDQSGQITTKKIIR